MLRQPKQIAHFASDDWIPGSFKDSLLPLKQIRLEGPPFGTICPPAKGKGDNVSVKLFVLSYELGVTSYSCSSAF